MNRNFRKFITNTGSNMQGKLLKKYITMKNFYRGLFWLLFIITIALIFGRNLSIYKDFLLPLAAMLFAIGQLWQNENKQEFEQKKYLQDRKDLYFDKRIEILMRINNYIKELKLDIFLPIYKMENEFSPERFNKILCQYNETIFFQAKYILSDTLNEKIENIKTLIKQMGDEILKMKNSNIPNSSDDENYAKLLSKLYDSIEILNKTAYDELKIGDF